ncbi:Diguanylate cyclase [Burkholderia sp. 8Y]|uniref:sensor domain-containing diguanylate cyclase n=1 Tax=Burkholderia sp. 8Y TaxID=2653133 RepID=UPI0012EEE6EE|nr:sensor domain-containing diguanylate cyclase [Burkholderia sp. 8Y]VXB33987.1 Diguanylate cyclase [Burkholderia sp. 8Y]
MILDDASAATSDVASDGCPTTHRRGSGFARRSYGLRCIGLAMGFMLVETVLWTQQASAGARLFVLAYCFGWPHVAFLLARRGAHPDRCERRNIYVDNMAGAMIVVAMKFAWLPSTLVLLMFMMNNVAAGGARLLARGSLFCLFGFGLGALVFGVGFDWGSVSASTIASAPMLIVYPLSLGIVTHRTAIKLADRSRALKHLNERDALTGLLNRATLARRLDETLARARAEGTRVSVLFIDLDEFKVVNDSLGHHFGDELLATVATRLAQTGGVTEQIGRYGGDGFVVVSTLPALKAVQSLAGRLIDAVNAPVQLGGDVVRPRLSVGISTCPEDGNGAQPLLNKADAAMYAAKHGGRNRWIVFGDELAELRCTGECGARGAGVHAAYCATESSPV